MGLSKQQKTLIGVLGLGGAALFVDRALLGYADTGPARADAAPIKTANMPPLQQTSAPETGGSNQDTPQRTLPYGLSVADRLMSTALAQNFDPDQIDDAFTPRSPWVVSATATSPQVCQDQASEKFLRDHHLVAVLGAGRSGLAVINGKTIRVGKSISGFTLVRVQKRSAVLTKAGTRVQLKLDPWSGPASDN